MISEQVVVPRSHGMGSPYFSTTKPLSYRAAATAVQRNILHGIHIFTLDRILESSTVTLRSIAANGRDKPQLRSLLGVSSSTILPRSYRKPHASSATHMFLPGPQVKVLCPAFSDTMCREITKISSCKLQAAMLFLPEMLYIVLEWQKADSLSSSWLCR